jgi:signal transduction histidine kinase
MATLSAPLRRLLRTYSFRITLLYIALFAAAVLILFGAIYWATTTFMRGQLRSAVETEMSSLVARLNAAGIEELAALVAQRTGSPGDAMSFYLLQDGDGTKIAGNLPAMRPDAGWHELPIPADAGGEDESDSLAAEGRVLPNGWFLLVGHDTDMFTDVEEIILHAVGWGLATAFAFALIGGLAISARLLRRVETIADAGREIIGGNLSRRIPLRGTDDEFDRLSATLNEMLDRIQMLMEGLRQVSNDIAHDLRTPLTRLRQYLDRARTKAATVAEYQRIVDKAIAETDEILDTFSALLRIAEIEAGTRRAAFTEVDLSGVVQGLVETYAAVAEDHRHHLAGEIAGGITVKGDRQLLTQMIANIVENAIRHTPENTRIDVKLISAPGGPVCTIADDGPGIPELDRQKVFRRFYRLDSSRATPGNGLGLSLVSAIAELHRIAIETCDNRPGLRITMRFTLSAI